MREPGQSNPPEVRKPPAPTRAGTFIAPGQEHVGAGMIHEGDLAPPFTAIGLGGAAVSLAEHRGQTLILVFLRYLG